MLQQAQAQANYVAGSHYTPPSDGLRHQNGFSKALIFFCGLRRKPVRGVIDSRANNGPNSSYHNSVLFVEITLKAKTLANTNKLMLWRRLGLLVGAAVSQRIDRANATKSSCTGRGCGRAAVKASPSCATRRTARQCAGGVSCVVI